MTTPCCPRKPDGSLDTLGNVHICERRGRRSGTPRAERPKDRTYSEGQPRRRVAPEIAEALDRAAARSVSPASIALAIDNAK